MNVTFEAWQLPRGNVVVRIVDGDRANPEVVSDHSWIQDAMDEAERRNMRSWLSEKPGDSPAGNWDADAETAVLLDILDRMLIPEEKCDVLEFMLRGMAA